MAKVSEELLNSLAMDIAAGEVPLDVGEVSEETKEASPKPAPKDKNQTADDFSIQLDNVITNLNILAQLAPEEDKDIILDALSQIEGLKENSKEE